MEVLELWSDWSMKTVEQIFVNTAGHDMPEHVVPQKQRQFMEWKIKELKLAKRHTLAVESEVSYKEWEDRELCDATEKLEQELNNAVARASMPSRSTTLSSEAHAELVLQHIKKHHLALQIGESEAFRNLVNVDKALAQDFLQTFNRIQSQRSGELMAVMKKVYEYLAKKFSEKYEQKNAMLMENAQIALEKMYGKDAQDTLCEKTQLVIKVIAATRGALNDLNKTIDEHRHATIGNIEQEVEKIREEQRKEQPKVVPEHPDPFFAAARGPSPSGWVAYILQWNQKHKWDNESDVFVLDHSNSALPEASGLYLNTNNDIVVWVESPTTGVRVTLVDRRNIHAHDTKDGFRWASIAGRLVQLSNRQHRRNATVWMIRRRTNAFPEDLVTRVTRVVIGD